MGRTSNIYVLQVVNLSFGRFGFIHVPWSKCIREHPSAHVAVLTNGKTFSNCEFTKRVAKTATDNVCFLCFFAF